jgi:hypothetical protein
MGHLLKTKCVDSRENMQILASTSVPFALTMVHVPNLALTLTKQIIVYKSDLTDYLMEYVQESLLSLASSRTFSPGEEDSSCMPWVFPLIPTSQNGLIAYIGTCQESLLSSATASSRTSSTGEEDSSCITRIFPPVPTL